MTRLTSMRLPGAYKLPKSLKSEKSILRQSLYCSQWAKNSMSSLRHVAIFVALLWSFPFLIANHMIQNGMAAENNIAATQPINANITLGNPILVIQHEKTSGIKPLVINGSYGLSVSASGNGTIKGISVKETGTTVVIFRPAGCVAAGCTTADVKGQRVITANDGSEGNITWYGIGHTNPDATPTLTGAASIHSGSSGKLASINNMVIILKSHGDKTGNGIVLGWEWK